MQWFVGYLSASSDKLRGILLIYLEKFKLILFKQVDDLNPLVILHKPTSVILLHLSISQRAVLLNELTWRNQSQYVVRIWAFLFPGSKYAKKNQWFVDTWRGIINFLLWYLFTWRNWDWWFLKKGRFWGLEQGDSVMYQSFDHTYWEVIPTLLLLRMKSSFDIQPLKPSQLT